MCVNSGEVISMLVTTWLQLSKGYNNGVNCVPNMFVTQNRPDFGTFPILECMKKHIYTHACKPWREKESELVDLAATEFQPQSSELQTNVLPTIKLQHFFFMFIILGDMDASTLHHPLPIE